MSTHRDRFAAFLRTAAAVAVGLILAGCQASADPRAGLQRNDIAGSARARAP